MQLDHKKSPYENQNKWNLDMVNVEDRSFNQDIKDIIDDLCPVGVNKAGLVKIDWFDPECRRLNKRLCDTRIIVYKKW